VEIFAGMLKQPTRKTGIDILGDVPRGVHFCLFYKIKEDLSEISKEQAGITGLTNLAKFFY
jgi:hypothetical protein